MQRAEIWRRNAARKNSRDLRTCLDLPRDRGERFDVSSICLSLYRVETNLARNSSPFKSPGTEHNTDTLYQEGSNVDQGPSLKSLRKMS